MSEQLRKLLKERKIALERDLANVLTDGADARTLREYERSFAAIDVLSKMNAAPPRPAWVLPLFVLGIALVVIGAASALRIKRPDMLVDARASAFTLAVARSGVGLISEQNIRVKSINIVGNGLPTDQLKGAQLISAIKFLPGALATFEQTPGCLDVQLLSTGPPSTGLILTAVMATAREGGLPPTEQVPLQSGTHVDICGEFPKDFVLIGSVERLELSRVHSNEAIDGKIRTASILGGSLRVPAVNQTLALKDIDQLFLADITKGWAVIRLAPELRVALSGKVGIARSTELMSGTEEDSATLVPTWLEWASKSSRTTGLFGLLTGLIGMLWSAAKYFGYRSA